MFTAVCSRSGLRAAFPSSSLGIRGRAAAVHSAHFCASLATAVCAKSTTTATPAAPSSKRMSAAATVVAVAVATGAPSKSASPSAEPKTPAAAAATAAPASARAASITTPADLLRFKKQAHALFLLRSTPQVALSAEAALQLVSDQSGQASVPAAERMTRAEAAEFLRACHRAGTVIIAPAPGAAAAGASKVTQMVYPDPVAVLDARDRILQAGGGGGGGGGDAAGADAARELAFHVEVARGHRRRREQMANHGQYVASVAIAAAATTPTAAATEAAAAAAANTATLAVDADTAAKRAVVSQHRFWAVVALGMSSQMLLFAYWTFIVYDWDVMEPFTYFVSCGYMIALFFYFVHSRRVHTFTEMDRLVLRRTVARNAVKRAAAAAAVVSAP